MTSVQSVTCCCFLWLMLSVQLITPSPPGTAHLPRDGTDRYIPDDDESGVCYFLCLMGIDLDECSCPEIQDLGLFTDQ
uniref:J_Vc14.1 prepropeptide n=1 Tax=Conus victoriae TaxID=319920 RepID=W4VSL8_CONVC